MIVRAEYDDLRDVYEEHLSHTGWTIKSRLDITAQKEYDVHAILFGKGIVEYFIITDLAFPAGLPACIFSIVDNSCRADWRIAAFPPHADLVIGPPFMVQDFESYEAMIEGRPDFVEMLKEWARLAVA